MKKYYLTLPLSESLYKKTRSLIQAFKTEDNPKKHKKELIYIILEISKASAQYHLLDTLHQINASKFIIITAELGIKTSISTSELLLKRVIKHLTAAQLKQIAEIVEGMICQINETKDEK